MPLKKTKGALVDESKVFVLLHDREKGRHFIAKQGELIYSRKDNLKPGSYATFSRNDDRSSRCKCMVVLSGSNEYCEQSLAIIDKMNSSFTRESDSDSVSSVNGETNCSDDDEKDADNDVEESHKETQTKNKMTSSNKSLDDNGTAGSVTSSKTTVAAVPSRKISADKMPNSMSISTKESISTKAATPVIQATVLTTTTTSQSSIDILGDISNTVDESRKRKETDEQLSSSITIKKRPGHVSHVTFEKLRRENQELKKQIQAYRENWMCRPTGPAASYLIDIGKILSGQSGVTAEEDAGEKLEEICSILNVNETELKSCEHETDITKTCRAIIKRIFPNSIDRAAMLISSMDCNVLKAIQTYARMVHPAQAKVPNSILNNAIGNVFASEKRNVERKQLEKRGLNETTNKLDDDDEDEDQ